MDKTSLRYLKNRPECLLFVAVGPIWDVVSKKLRNFGQGQKSLGPPAIYPPIAFCLNQIGLLASRGIIEKFDSRNRKILHLLGVLPIPGRYNLIAALFCDFETDVKGDDMARSAILKGIEHLHDCDQKLSKIIERAGPCTLKRESNHFWMLVRSILSQQISTSAATTIRNRVDDLMQQSRSADALAQLTDEQLRTAGVSKQKICYLRSLTDKVLSNEVCLKTISKCSNEEITQQLIQIKGIGVWTADMFLIFSLGRLDVFPIGDGGVKAAMRKIYKLSDEEPTTQYHKIAAKWQPYATVGSWYCWRALELKND